MKYLIFCLLLISKNFLFAQTENIYPLKYPFVINGMFTYSLDFGEKFKSVRKIEIGKEKNDSIVTECWVFGKDGKLFSDTIYDYQDGKVDKYYIFSWNNSNLESVCELNNKNDTNLCSVNTYKFPCILTQYLENNIEKRRDLRYYNQDSLLICKKQIQNFGFSEEVIGIDSFFYDQFGVTSRRFDGRSLLSTTRILNLDSLNTIEYSLNQDGVIYPIKCYEKLNGKIRKIIKSGNNVDYSVEKRFYNGNGNLIEKQLDYENNQSETVVYRYSNRNGTPKSR